jgi:hypothetical protein
MVMAMIDVMFGTKRIVLQKDFQKVLKIEFTKTSIN